MQRLRFHFDLKLLIITLLACAVLVKLGLWQLERAQYKSVLYKEFLDKQSATAIKNPDLTEFDKKMLWRNVSLTGSFDNTTHILLDNQVRQGKTGYMIYTRFKPNLSSSSILVNRGWVKADLVRDILPNIDANPSQHIEGIIKTPPKTGLLLKETPADEIGNIRRVQDINLEKLSTLLGYDLSPFILKMTSAEYDDDYAIDSILAKSEKHKHIAYAWQWFAFAAILLIGYFTLSIKRNPTKRE